MTTNGPNPRCPDCGGTELWRPMLAYWDVDTKEWKLADHFHNSEVAVHCMACEAVFTWRTATRGDAS